MTAIKVSPKGQIVIPKKLREKYGIAIRGKVIVTEMDNHVVILPLPQDPIKGAKGMLKTKKSLAQTLKEYKAEEKELEQEHLPRMP
ncbi:AbrB/MazE/SpoVT family DNA-binding domain-containing protein [Dehalococcoidales bacterium]|nr:AbrB/MazE/SpoVT family DNA-binding domain-containing protein [Dehalococcoidales bacterium]